MFDCQGEEALAQDDQRVCGVSNLGGIQKPSGHGPDNPAIGESPKQGVGASDLQTSLPNYNSSVIP